MIGFMALSPKEHAAWWYKTRKMTYINMEAIIVMAVKLSKLKKKGRKKKPEKISEPKSQLDPSPSITFWFSWIDI